MLLWDIFLLSFWKKFERSNSKNKIRKGLRSKEDVLAVWYIFYIYFISFHSEPLNLGIFLVGYWMFLTVNSFCYFEIYSSSLSEKNLNVLTQKIKSGKALEVRRMFWQYDIYFIYILFLFIQNLQFRYLFSRLLNVFNS